MQSYSVIGDEKFIYLDYSRYIHNSFIRGGNCFFVASYYSNLVYGKVRTEK